MRLLRPLRQSQLNLRRINRGTERNGRDDVDDRALPFLTKPQLCVALPYLEMTCQYWTNYIRNERESRAANGLAVLCQCVTQIVEISTRKAEGYANLKLTD